MINDRTIDQAFSDLRSTCGGVREDYYGLLYLEQEHKVPRDRAIHQVAFGGNDYGIDGFHFDEERRNLYLFQFKYSKTHGQFKGSFQRLIADGLERVFVSPNKDAAKNQILHQLRSCLIDNRNIIDQICFRFVFTGEPEEAERSPVLDALREQLEDKNYLVDRFFGERKVRLLVEFRSSTGVAGHIREPRRTEPFDVPLTDLVEVMGPHEEKMHLGFIRLMDLYGIYKALGSRFFDRNIRYGLGESEAVNRAISGALKRIVLEKSDHPSVFSFDHNGITLYAQQVEYADGMCSLTAPRLLNGAQTVTTVADFRDKNKDNPKLEAGDGAFQDIKVLCKIITNADQKFVTRVTVNNNRQNPVSPWNLHANDFIQLELQDKLREDVGIYYERQENAFAQLSPEDLEEAGIEDNKAIQLLKLTHTFLLTDGLISRLSDIRRVFEEESQYDRVFRQARLKADSRALVLCYKVQFRLRKLVREIEEKGYKKYWFVARARSILWALVCQGLLNRDDFDEVADRHGSSMGLPADFTDLLIQVATTKVRPLLADLMADKDYTEKVADQNLSFLRTDKAFDKCMEMAYKKWKWVHKKLG